jgi:serine/threonine-protein kinase
LLVISFVDEPSANITAGNATRTDPANSTLVDPGSTIVLYISSGPAKVTVPPLVGVTQAQAEAKLREIGLTPDITYQSVPFGDSSSGRVLGQTPSGGVQVDPGSTVKLKIAKALPAPTTTTAAPTTTLAPTTTAAPATTTTAPPGP